MYDSVFVNRMNWGTKYLFANLSIPVEWIGAGAVIVPADLSRLLGTWHEAYVRELSRAASEHGARIP